MNKQDIHAFPSPNVDADNGSTIYGNLGMTLRDYFAAKAMQAYIASKPPQDMDDDKYIADISYSMADAMLSAK